jgi:hypothetical protein
VIAHHGRNPGLRAAAAGQYLPDLAQHVPTKLEPAELQWLANPQETGGIEICHAFVGTPAPGFAGGTALTQHRHQRFSTAQHFFARHNHDLISPIRHAAL